MRKWLVILCTAILPWLTVGCGSDERPEPGVEVYVGELFTDVHPMVVGEQHVVTVQLTVEGPRYSFLTIQGDNGICDSEGRVNGFGGNGATFLPDRRLGLNCDSVNVPQGAFPTDFRPNGDSLKMSRTDAGLDMFWRFRLERQ
jgi:hypothetical protein